MSVHDQIEAIAARFSGTLGVWARSLDSGETIAVGAEEAFPSASTIKLPILYEVYRQAGEGRFALTDPVSVTADDVVPGSGILKDLRVGATLSVFDMATLMIVVSDNTATNLMIDLVGIEAVNKSCEALGLAQTSLNNKLFKGKPGSPMNATSPQDLGRLMLGIAKGELLTPKACREMMEILGRQHYTEAITRRIPDFDAFVDAGTEPAATVASKSGSIRGVRNDVGFVRARGRQFVISMMSKGCADPRFYPDNEGALALADVSEVIYKHFVG